jgi:hypothetical protein
MARYDDVIIDALNYQARRPLIPELYFSNNLSGIRDMSRIPPNPFALGHLFNHPPRGSPSNVVPCSYDVPLDFAEHLRYLLPFRYIRSPSLFDMKAHEILLHGLLLIASTDINDGQEIYLK